MSTVTGEGAAPPPATGGPFRPRSQQLWSRSDRRWDRFRWMLLVCWLIVAAATVLTGERTASWGQLRALVATGEVDTVRVVGELPARVTGYSVVEVHFRHGLMRYSAEVVQVGGRDRPGPEAATDAATQVIREQPSSRLAALQPGITVTRDQERSSGGRLFGWQVPSWLALGALLLLLGGFGALVAGPQPWRATRWAWFWLSTTPLGGIVFLLASGPTPGLPGPRDPNRRLTGGWAFLLSLALTSVLAPDRW